MEKQSGFEKGDERQVLVLDFMGNKFLGHFEGRKMVRDALELVLLRLPDDAFEEIFYNRNVVVIDACNSAAWPWQFVCPPHEAILRKWFYFVVLRQTLHESPFEAIVGEIAHEFAHVFLRHDLESPESAQDEADAVARQWGFQQEIDFYQKQPKS